MIVVTAITAVVNQTDAVAAKHAKRDGMIGIIVNHSDGAVWMTLAEARNLRNRLNAAISYAVKEGHDG